MMRHVLLRANRELPSFDFPTFLKSVEVCGTMHADSPVSPVRAHHMMPVDSPLFST